MKIDLTTIIGLVVAIAGIFVGYYLEGGDFSALIAISPILIIFGGTIGVVTITQPSSTLKQLPGIMRALFTEKNYDYLQLVETLCECADLSRRNGIVALDDKRKEVEEPFLQRSLKLIVDNNAPEDVKHFLENDISMMEQRHANNQKIFSAAGGYAPTMGIVGTVLGLVVVLAGLGGSGIEELGHGIAVAFLATFMGVASANLMYLPFDNKLKMKTQQEVLYKEMAMQGILAIQANESPLILRERLLSLLPEYMRQQTKKKEKEGE